MRNMEQMHVEYTKKINPTYWDPVKTEYPIRKWVGTGESSKTLGHEWRGQPGVLRDRRELDHHIKSYDRDYSVTHELNRSQTKIDYGFKLPETRRHNKHTSCSNNQYVYPPSRQLQERVPAQRVHGTTEMRDSYKTTTFPPTLVTQKDQYKHPKSIPSNPPASEPSFYKDIEPLDTTHEGYEKYLDPYLTTSRLHHRPYTADQLSKPSVSQDIATYYTLNENTIWIHRPITKHDDWWVPTKRPKSMYDREKFKEDFREIRTHNKLINVPGAFRTESRDNYCAAGPQIENYEDSVRNDYLKLLANLQTNINQERLTRTNYSTENSQIGSRKPVCLSLKQFREENKRLLFRSTKNKS